MKPLIQILMSCALTALLACQMETMIEPTHILVEGTWQGT